MSAPLTNPPWWTPGKVIAAGVILSLVAIAAFAGCRSSDKIVEVISPVADPIPKVQVTATPRYKDHWDPPVQDPAPATDPFRLPPEVNPLVEPQAPPTVLPTVEYRYVTNAPVTIYVTNPPVTIYVTNLPVLLRQTNNRVEFVYTNGPASTPIQAGQMVVNLPPPSGGPLVASGGYLQVAGHDNFIGWHPGMSQGGQQLTPTGAIPGTAGHFQKVNIGQSFALNKGQIAVIDFPNGNNPPCKISATGGKTRILYDGLTEEEMLQQSGSLHGAKRMTVENTVDEVLLARTEQ